MTFHFGFRSIFALYYPSLPIICDSTSEEGLATACTAQALVRNLAFITDSHIRAPCRRKNLSLPASPFVILRSVRSRGELREHNQMYSRMMDAISMNKARMGRSLSVVFGYPRDHELLIDDQEGSLTSPLSRKVISSPL